MASGDRGRVLVVIGTRPEAIKMAPVVEGFRRREGRLDLGVALTGQHTTLVDHVLQTFDLVPDYDLGIMKEGQTLYDVAHRCIDGISGVVRHFAPDVILVQGDTATVFFTSLVAFFEQVRIGHVEAGLRSGQKWAPFPEEIFRRLTDQLTDYYFAPTALSRENLLKEGVPENRIHVTGNTVVDALMAMAEREHEVRDGSLRKVLEGGRRLILLTAHRRESFGEPLRRVFKAVRTLADQHPDIEVLYPVHPNPSVVEAAREILSDHERVHLTDPLDYLDLVAALQGAELVLTDSGGIQEEAPTFGTRVLVLRDVTERPEGVEAGVSHLVGTDPVRILEVCSDLLGAIEVGHPSSTPVNPYGDGQAGERIADIIASALTAEPRETKDWSHP